MRLLRKKIALLKLELKIRQLWREVGAIPNIKEILSDRQAHIERGELWITEDAIKLAPLMMQIAMLTLRYEMIRAMPINNNDGDGKNVGNSD